MKRRDVIKEIKAHAAVNGLSYREVEGAKHTVVTVGGRRTVLARHREINELTVNDIRRQLGMERG